MYKLDFDKYLIEYYGIWNLIFRQYLIEINLRLETNIRSTCKKGMMN